MLARLTHLEKACYCLIRLGDMPMPVHRLGGVSSHATGASQQPSPLDMHYFCTSTVSVGTGAHPTAAVRFRLPVARMIEDASAATTVAPSRLHRYCNLKLPVQKMAGCYSCHTSDSEERCALWLINAVLREGHGMRALT